MSAPELQTFAFLQELPKPVILGLDRTVLRDPRESPTGRQMPAISSVEQLQELANNRYSSYQSRMLDLSSKLKDQIILSSFDADHLNPRNKPLRVQLSQIQKWRHRFGEYMRQTPNSKTGLQKELRDAAKLYFDKLEELLEAPSRAEEMLKQVSSEFRKLQNLISFLEAFESDSEQAYAPIKNYLDTLNSFFRDSSKRLWFKDDTNQICFQILDKKDKPVGDPRDLELMASGEKQLFTLFTFIKFSAARVFIIDEPEVSLHPKWQEGFMDGIKGLMPENTQMILATHSPALVGKYRDYCQVLLPYNK